MSSPVSSSFWPKTWTKAFCLGAGILGGVGGSGLGDLPLPSPLVGLVTGTTVTSVLGCAAAAVMIRGRGRMLLQAVGSGAHFPGH